MPVKINARRSVRYLIKYVVMTTLAVFNPRNAEVTAHAHGRHSSSTIKVHTFLSEQG